MVPSRLGVGPVGASPSAEAPLVEFDPTASSLLVDLVEANEKLVIGMLRAKEEVETAAKSLGEITRQAELDPLTGLPNRILLLDRFARAIAAAARHRGKLALLFLDLDNFKQINDTAGHDEGDRALMRVSRCLLSTVRNADTVSRIGGDEFLILLTEIAHTSDATVIAQKVITALDNAGLVTDEARPLTASIGVSIYPDDGDDPATLISAADAAMYRAKRAGGRRFVLHGGTALVPESGDPPESFRPRPVYRTSESSHAKRELLNVALRESNEELLFAALREADGRKRLESSMEIVLEAAQMGSWELDLATGNERRSALHDRIFGHSDAVATWTLYTTLEHFVPEDREEAAEAFQRARGVGSLDLERRIQRFEDGQIRWVHMKGRTVPENGEHTRMVGVVADVTERRAMEDQLRQSQKLEAIGQLTGGIAHDFNNLLLVIGGSLELLTRRLPPEPSTTRLIDTARRGVATGVKLNQQLLAFARRQDLRLELVSVEQLLPALSHLLQMAASESLDVVATCAPDIWLCRTDPHQLQVAVLNLAINARDAISGTGRIALTVGNRTVDEARASMWGAAAGDYVAVAVTDSGAGMSPEVIARAFEPFFTTKEVGKGTGLGLSQVYGFAKQSGGFVSLESTADGPTTVTIHLPRSEATPLAGQAPSAPLAPRRKRGVAILVVEDDTEVRAIVCAMLVGLGHAVIEAATADAALAIAERGDSFDLVLTDVIMPGSSGVELACTLRRKRPDLAVLLTSGYTAQRTIADDAGCALGLLHKPYSQDALALAIDEAIQRHPAV